MKRALTALGTFAAIGSGVLLGAMPAAAASCIQGSTGCSIQTSVNDDPGMTHNGSSGTPRH